MEMIWVEAQPPHGQAVPAGVDVSALRAGMDGDGTIWAWAGLFLPSYLALMLAVYDDEPVLLDDGKEYLRLSWMRSNLARCDESMQLADIVGQIVRRMATQ